MKSGISPLQFFNLAVGMIIGVGWITVLGFWISSAAPGGATIAFVGGALLLMPVAVCYAYMAAEYPITGGPIVYAVREIGPVTAFLTGWLLFLNFTLVVMFEVISVAWVLDELIPGLDGPLLYSVMGSDIHLGHLVIGIGGNILLGIVNLRGGVNAARLQDFLTWILIATILTLGVFALLRGDAQNLSPFFQLDASDSALPGMLAVLITVPFFLTGFDAIAQGMAESGVKITKRLVTRLYVLAIVMAAVLYIIIILSASAVAPRESFLGAELPTAEAFRVAFGSEWAMRVVLLGGLAGLLSTWNGCIFTAARALHGLGEQGLISRKFSVGNAAGVSTLGVASVVAIGSIGALFGRSAVLPLVNSASVGFGMVFFVVALCVLRFHLRQGRGAKTGNVFERYFIPISAMAVSLFIAWLAFYEPKRNLAEGIPFEWYLFCTLLGLGLLIGLWRLMTGDARGLRSNAGEPDGAAQ